MDALFITQLLIFVRTWRNKAASGLQRKTIDWNTNFTSKPPALEFSQDERKWHKPWTFWGSETPEASLMKSPAIAAYESEAVFPALDLKSLGLVVVVKDRYWASKRSSFAVLCVKTFVLTAASRGAKRTWNRNHGAGPFCPERRQTRSRGLSPEVERLSDSTIIYGFPVW